jgi:hypothetical protein
LNWLKKSAILSFAFMIMKDGGKMSVGGSAGVNSLKIHPPLITSRLLASHAIVDNIKPNLV